MALSDIQIHRQYPIVNGYVQVPPCLDKDKTSVALETLYNYSPPIGVGEVVRLNSDFGKVQGSLAGAQEFIRAYGVAADGANVDYDATMRNS